MNTSHLKPKDVDHYISGFPVSVQEILKKLRATIRKAAPNAAERISYGMPFYEYGGKGYKGRLIYFAAFKQHISLFITPWYSESVPKELKKYNVSKATYRFDFGKPFPFSLIEKAVKAMVKERDRSMKKQNEGKPTLKKQPVNMAKEIRAYNSRMGKGDKAICDLLAEEINIALQSADNKIWHGHPVWFLNGNPIVGYSKQKKGIRLMFWSGAGFEEPLLNVRGEKFKDASIFYTSVSDIKGKDLKRWLKKSEHIQWDYKNIVKRKGKLIKLKRDENNTRTQ